MEVSNIKSMPTRRPAEITDPGIAQPDVEINIEGLSILDCLQLKASATAKDTVIAEAKKPTIDELINNCKLDIRLKLGPEKFQIIS